MITNRFFLLAALLGAVCSTARGQDTTEVQSALEYYQVDGQDYAAVKCAAVATTFEGAIVIPDSAYVDSVTFLPVRLIPQKAFNKFVGLAKVTIEGKDVEIQDSCFAGCTTLTTVEVTGSIKRIMANAFNGCTSLRSIDLVEGLESIGAKAFSSCASLNAVSIPKSVTSLSNSCFLSCSALEKVHFEGGGLTKIPTYAFYACGSIKKLSIPEGVTSIGAEAFYNCSELETITLPKTLTTLNLSAFSKCDTLTAVKLYATTPPSVSGSGSETSSATLFVPDVAAYKEAGWGDYFTGGIESIFTFAASDDGAISAVDSETFLDIFRALSDTAGAYVNSNVRLESDIVFNAIELGLDTLSASNIYTLLDAFPTVEAYDGKFNGATISNMAMRSAGIFGTLGDSAKVNNLVLQGALLYVDPTDSTFDIDADTVTIHLLARANNGAVTNFGFSGDIIVDEALATGKEISVCAVNEMGDSATINGFVYVNSLITTGNTKRCITIKQNLGVKRPPGKSTKVATQKSLSSNKSVPTFDFDREELLQPVCAFTDEEFESGIVAYWLNYSGPGFTGDYTGYWAQGKKVPVPATTVGGVSNALQKVDYGATEMKHITTAPLFANNGSEITVEYDEQPTSVTIGGEEFKSFGATSMTVKFDSAKPIVLAFNKSEESSLDTPAADKVSISTSGLTVSVSGTTADLQLVSLTGKVVAASNGQSVTAPAPGLYLLKVDGSTFKVMLK